MVRIIFDVQEDHYLRTGVGGGVLVGRPGKIVQWFSPDMVESINNEVQGFAHYFVNPDSIDILPPNCTFEEPDYFQKRIDQLEASLIKVRSLQQEHAKKVAVVEERVKKLQTDKTI